MQPILRFTLAIAILNHLPFTLGSACTLSNASPYTKGGGSTTDGCSAADIARDDTGCVKQYCTNGGTSASLQTCFCLALGEQNCGSTIKRRHYAAKPKSKRQAFSCSGSDKCYINPVDGGLFCLNTSTGDYVGESGDSGNVDTGAYTPASGGSSTAAATSSSGRRTTVAGSSFTSQLATRASTAAGTSTTAEAAAATGSTSNTALASSTRSAGQAKITAGAVLGALGLAVGIVLG